MKILDESRKEIENECAELIRIHGHKPQSFSWDEAELSFMCRFYGTRCSRCNQAIEAEVRIRESYNDDVTAMTVNLYVYDDETNLMSRSGITFYVPDTQNARMKRFAHSFREYHFLGEKRKLYCPKLAVML